MAFKIVLLIEIEQIFLDREKTKMETVLEKIDNIIQYFGLLTIERSQLHNSYAK